MEFILLFFLGATLGSFYHVVGYRMPIGQNFISDRSRCPSCSQQLKFYELIPIVSYVLQGGKCRTCHIKIKSIYVLSEIFTGLLFLFPVCFYGIEGFTSGEIFIAWTFLSLLIIISVSDIYYQLILDKVLLFFAGLLILIYIIYPKYSLVLGLIGAGFGFIVLYGIGLLGQFIFKKEALGGGDIKLYADIGFILGITNTLLSLFLAAIFALVFMLFFMKDRNKLLSFGPFIALASYICLFYGSLLINWYLNVLSF
ncbi:MAG: prepilin peptidase [Turicibacter sp.]|nr:prepilin peptidase [Turicibacter sp.]